MARLIYRRHRLPPALILDAAACSKALHDHIVTTATTPPTPTEVPEMAAKKSAAKAKPPAKSQAAPVAAKLDALVEATAARLMAARPAPEAPVDVPGVTQGKPARAVGAPSVAAFGGLSIAAMKKLVAPLIKNALELGVKFGGQTVEDLAASQADLLDDFVPDAVYELIESIAHKMHGGEPHVVGATTPPTKPV